MLAVGPSYPNPLIIVIRVHASWLSYQREVRDGLLAIVLNAASRRAQLQHKAKTRKVGSLLVQAAALSSKRSLQQYSP